jgi:hypothetical protein
MVPIWAWLALDREEPGAPGAEGYGALPPTGHDLCELNTQLRKQRRKWKQAASRRFTLQPQTELTLG